MMWCTMNLSRFSVLAALLSLSACDTAPKAPDPLSLGPAPDQETISSPASSSGSHHSRSQFGGAPGLNGTGPSDGSPSSSGSVSFGGGG